MFHYNVNNVIGLVDAQRKHIQKLEKEMSEIPKFMNVGVQVKLDDPKLMPYRAHPSDAGADLFTATSVTIYPQDQQMVDTGVAVKIPLGHVGLVFNRSSQGKKRVQIANGTGVIDSDYRGTIKVLLVNNGLDPYHIIKYETRIAQLVIVPILLGDFIKWTDTTEAWNDTVRGEGGFGSTAGT